MPNPTLPNVPTDIAAATVDAIDIMTAVRTEDLPALVEIIKASTNPVGLVSMLARFAVDMSTQLGHTPASWQKIRDDYATLTR